jgi:hypothetical protein
LEEEFIVLYRRYTQYSIYYHCIHSVSKSLIIAYFEVLSQKRFEPKQKKKNTVHPRFGPGSVPTFVINTAGAGLFDPSALNLLAPEFFI